MAWHTRHILQNLLAVLPWWLQSSEHIGLSPSIINTGATTKTFWPKCASYSSTPPSSLRRFCTSGSAIAKVPTLLRKWILSSWFLISWGNPNTTQKINCITLSTCSIAIVSVPAIEIFHSMNLFHFFDRFPLVSSQKRIRGIVVTGRPPALDFVSWTDLKASHSYQYNTIPSLLLMNVQCNLTLSVNSL